MKNPMRIKPLLVIAGAVFILFWYRCPIKYLSGISCPGCGMTRALFACLRFRFADALRYHPLIVLLPAAAAVCCLELTGIHHFAKRTRNIMLWSVSALFVAVYIIRLCAGSEIVTAHPSAGLAARIVQWVRECLGTL